MSNQNKLSNMSKLKITPIAGTQNRVLVEPFEAETKTASGIIIPDTAKEKPMKGKVISTSAADDKGNKPTVKTGDTVLYGKYAGTEITFDGKEYLIMREADIFAVI